LSEKNIRKKRQLQKLKTFELAEDDRKLLDSTHEDLKESILHQLENKIEENLMKIDEINKLKNSAETEEEKTKYKKMKKNIMMKLNKNRNALKDQKEIKYRLDLLKQKKRKLKAVESSINENLEKLKKMNVKCFKCRRTGHTVQECKYDDILNEKEEKEQNEKNEIKNKNFKKENSIQKNICYNCGKDDHTVHGCPLPVDYSNLPFSKCFICFEMGHLSSKCPKSDKGIYIKGGACFECGANDHLAKNCPTKQIALMKENKEEKEKKNKKKEDKIELELNEEDDTRKNSIASLEEDNIEEERIKKSKKKKQKEEKSLNKKTKRE